MGDPRYPFAVPYSAARPPATRATYARLLAVPAIWGGTFIAGRTLALALPAAVGALLRYLVAVGALLVATRWIEGGLPRLSRRQALATLLLGATGIFAYNLFFPRSVGAAAGESYFAHHRAQSGRDDCGSFGTDG